MNERLADLEYSLLSLLALMDGEKQKRNVDDDLDDA